MPCSQITLNSTQVVHPTCRAESDWQDFLDVSALCGASISGNSTALGRKGSESGRKRWGKAGVVVFALPPRAVEFKRDSVLSSEHYACSCKVLAPMRSSSAWKVICDDFVGAKKKEL